MTGANGYGVYSGGDENVLEWTVMTVVQLCEYPNTTEVYTLNG